jgi:hypothetical protein
VDLSGFVKKVDPEVLLGVTPAEIKGATAFFNYKLFEYVFNNVFDEDCFKGAVNLFFKILFDERPEALADLLNKPTTVAPTTTPAVVVKTPVVGSIEPKTNVLNKAAEAVQTTTPAVVVKAPVVPVKPKTKLKYKPQKKGIIRTPVTQADIDAFLAPYPPQLYTFGVEITITDKVLLKRYFEEFAEFYNKSEFESEDALIDFYRKVKKIGNKESHV